MFDLLFCVLDMHVDVSCASVCTDEREIRDKNIDVYVLNNVFSYKLYVKSAGLMFMYYWKIQEIYVAYFFFKKKSMS